MHSRVFVKSGQVVGVKGGSHVDAYTILIKLLAFEVAAQKFSNHVLQRSIRDMIRPVDIARHFG